MQPPLVKHIGATAERASVDLASEAHLNLDLQGSFSLPRSKVNSPEPKPLPMKAITLGVGGLFVFLAVGFLIVPAFFDKDPFGGRLFEAGPAPWALSEQEQARFQYTEAQLKGRYHFQNYCASCHGPEGRGNGPSSATLNRRPPNFITTASNGFRNGLAKDQILKTLEEGIPGSEMPAYKHLPAEVKDQIAEFIVYLNTHPSLF
jgi:mono/diheme cytochrome c family protein